MFIFIVPRMPTRLRSKFRDYLWLCTKKSLLSQKSNNWKAIVLSDGTDVQDSDHFIYLLADDYPKIEKLKIALDYITNSALKPEYLIRLDADDLISSDILWDIEQSTKKCDLYFDPVHVCIDPLYMKISYARNNWIANTAIHKYEHAVKRCGPTNEILLLQDHDFYWHEYYAGRNICGSTRKNPIYYRILSPYSITSTDGVFGEEIVWNKHLAYLNSYGPWLPLSKKFRYYPDVQSMQRLLPQPPKRNFLYWPYNLIKHCKNIILGTTIEKDGTVKKVEKKRGNQKECIQCVLGTNDDPDISFNSDGLCNYCQYYHFVTSRLGSMEDRSNWIENKVKEIKSYKSQKKYNCILGLSGGVDSSYLAYWAKNEGLKPLVVHFDNGWNSELAVQNIQNICEKLNFPLQTFVIDWEEFKELQLAYLRAGVIDIEVLTDHAILATMYKIARQFHLKYVISGFNYATEAIMPKGWAYDKTDYVNIKDINTKFGKRPIKTYPHVTFRKKLKYAMFNKMETVNALNYLNYDKSVAKEILKEKLGWRDYGGKHFESIFTKFYQSYILPVKFGVDKRRAHLSNLICSGQITKQEAQRQLSQPLYDPDIMIAEKQYVLKKLGLTEKEFDHIMSVPPRKHTDFKTQEQLWNIYFRTIKVLRPWRK